MLDTVIFDMDGLLIDSEPLWQKAGIETLKEFGINLTVEQYYESTGLRTSEWIEWWFTRYNIDKEKAKAAITAIEEKAIENIRIHGEAYPGTRYILEFFKERNFTIGLGTSSPLRLVDVVVEKLGIKEYFTAYSSAEYLTHGKPHPEVFMNCALELGANPLNCLCFEDSFNGMIAAKAAKMKCVVVPAALQYEESRWNAADLKLRSLKDFNKFLLERMSFN